MGEFVEGALEPLSGITNPLVKSPHSAGVIGSRVSSSEVCW